MALEIKISDDIKICEYADALRKKVFIDEQGVPEEEIFDGYNNKAVHVVIINDNSAVATSRIRYYGGNWHIGLVAVDKLMRGKHFGEKIMQAAIDYINSCGGKEILLDAQQQVCEFYEKLGFIQSGKPVVFESGFILVPMKLTLQTNN